jgi:hypothetical protein
MAELEFSHLSLALEFTEEVVVVVLVMAAMVLEDWAVVQLEARLAAQLMQPLILAVAVVEHIQAPLLMAVQE